MVTAAQGGELRERCRAGRAVPRDDVVADLPWADAAAGADGVAASPPFWMRVPGPSSGEPRYGTTVSPCRPISGIRMVARIILRAWAVRALFPVRTDSLLPLSASSCGSGASRLVAPSPGCCSGRRESFCRTDFCVSPIEVSAAEITTTPAVAAANSAATPPM
jgi:hypothetical protein